MDASKRTQWGYGVRRALSKLLSGHDETGKPPLRLLQSTERWVAVGFAFLLIFLAIVAVMSYRSVAGLRQRAAWVSHTQQVISTSRMLMVSVIAAETDERAYLITGREEYLQPYHSAVHDVGSELAQLRSLTTNNPLEHQRLAGLAPLLAERIKQFEQGIELRRQSFQSAKADLANGRGEQLTGRIRNSLAAVEVTENAFLGNRRALQRRAAQIANWVTLGGAVLAILVVVAAIWATRQGFKASRESERRLAMAMQAGHSGTFEWDMPTNTVISSEELLALYGLRQDEFGGRFEDWIDAVVPEDREEVAAKVKRARATGILDLEFRVRRRDNREVRWMQLLGRVFLDQSGEPVRMAGVHVDITERKMVEQRYRALFESINEAFCVIDLIFDEKENAIDWRYLEANSAFRRQPGFDNPVGKTIRELVPTIGPNWLEIYGNVAVTGEQVRKVEFSPALNRWFDICAFRVGEAEDRRVGVLYTDVTERKDTEEALRHSEAELKEAQRIAHVGSWILDLRTGSIVGSEELDRIFARDPSMPRIPLSEGAQFFTPDSWIHLLETQRTVIESGTGRQIDLEIIRADGTRGWVSVRGEPERDASGKVVRLRGTMQDVTERRQVEEALRRSEANLKDAQRMAHVGNWTWDPATNSVVWSEELYRIFGRDPNQPPPQLDEAAELFGQSTERVDETRDRAVQYGVPMSLDREIVRADGTRRWVSAHGEPERDASGNVVRLRGTVQDITERRQAEEALRRREADLREAQRIAHVGNWTWDAATQKVSWSEEVYRVLGRDPSQPPLSIDDSMRMFTPESWTRVGETTVKAIRDRTPFQIDLEVIRPDGSHGWLTTFGEPDYDADGRFLGLRGTMQDITERKRAQEELAQQARDLARSNADLEQFAYVASHDLKEPLRAVSGCVRLLQRRYEGKLDERADQYITLAVDGTVRMSALIDGLLAYARVASRGAEFHIVDCNEALETAIQNLSTAIQETGAVISVGPLPAVEGDTAQLASLFQNLIGNALKFRKEVAPQIAIAAECHGERWRFSVRDNGIGIEPQYFERIFGVFQQLHTRREFPGTGIGLAISKKIVERHGGTMWVDSTPGAGTTFYFTLPSQMSPRQGERKTYA